MANNHGRLHAVTGKLRPVFNMHVCAAQGNGMDFDEDIVGAGHRYGLKDNGQIPRRRCRLGNAMHKFCHTLTFQKDALPGRAKRLFP